MIIRTEHYMGFQLALKKNDESFQVIILNADNRLVSSTAVHSGAETALGEARRYIDALRTV